MEHLNEIRAIERNRELLQDAIPQRGLHDRTNPLELYNNDEFRARYRFSKETALELVNMLEGDLKRNTGRSAAIPVILQVLTALRFYAVGTFQKMHGDEARLSQSSVCRIVKDVSVALASRKELFVQFPTTREQVAATQQQFYEYCRFPGVIGAIDGTHVYIRSPGGNNALYFINRKNRYSINVQVVCDYAGKFTNIVARWPGSTHDSRIFSESALKRQLEATANGTQWLLGDSGYACLPFLMTPLLRPNGRPQERYNASHKRGRCIIERSFGRWKRRFPCLNDLRMKLDTTLIVIVACSVLWNLSLDRREPDFPGPEPEVEPPVHLPPGHHDALAGRLRRTQIIEEHFTR